MKIYVIPKCKSCGKLREYLDEKDVKYEMIDISKPGNIKIKKKMKSKGLHGVPILETDDDIIMGNDLGLVDVILEKELKNAKI